ncbi:MULTISPECIES: APC family permease [unclassified Vagococcus]|uniref:APC family permease n=1 Tax=unclassified Vagococcus TaxID=2648499 RepID=UPI001F50527B|nr:MULTISPECIES: amino acid permease [unclassified Vagococcus]MCI0130270.1 amino acid permease [Vagococcus sp. CY53-2]UNM89090.1 amino acid permease [Vagococcus sp. CY52-2]
MSNQEEIIVEDSNQLNRTMTFFPALSTVMGTVIGGGVFFKAASVTQSTGSASLTLMSWFLGGVISICAGLTAAELSAAIPETGGMVRYIERAYGKLWSFLLGWALIIIYFPANVAALSIIFGTQFKNLFGLSHSVIVPIAILVGGSIMLINFLGARASGIFQSITLVCKLIPLALIVIFGLLRQGDVSVSLFPVTAGAQTSGFFPALGAGLLATMFAYDGWIHVGNISGELKNPERDLPRSIAGGLFGVMVIYLLVNFVYLKSLPIESLAGNENAAMDVSKQIFGDFGGKIVTIGILISVYGAINGYTMTGMRIPYTMGLDKQLPYSNQLAKLNRNKVPFIAGLFELAVAVVMMLLGGFDILTDMLVFVIWIFYTLVFCAVIKLRKKEPDLPRPYKVPLYPFIPIISIIGGVFILSMTLINQLSLVVTGLGLTALGIPFYLYANRKKTRK